MSITTTETRRDFHVKPVEKCLGNPKDLFGWPSGERFVIQQEFEAGSAYYSREAIQTIVEALQAWLDESAPKAFEVKVGDRVQLNADKALWVNGTESGAQPGRGALGTIEDGVDSDGDIWVYWGDQGRGAVDPALLLPAGEEPMPDWERELLGLSDDREAAKAAHPSSQPAPAFAEGDRVRVTGERGRFAHCFDTGTEGVVDRVDLSDDSVRVETDDDIQWVGFEQLEKVDAHSDEEREANGKLVFVGERGSSVWVAAAGGRVEHREIGGAWPYLHGFWEVSGFDPDDFKPIEPTLPFGDGVIKAGDRVKIRTKKVSGDPRWTKVSESGWLEVKVNIRNELHADGRILAHDNVTILEHYPAAEREANDKLVFVAGYTVVSWADVPHSYDSIPAGGVNWYPVNLDPADFHPIPEPEPLKVRDRVRLINLKEPYWTCQGADEFTGRTGVVLELLDDGHFDTRVAVDGDGLSSRGLAFSELERV